MRHKEKRRCSPTRTRRERGADVPGPNSGVHGLACLVKKRPHAPKLCCGLEWLCDVVSTRDHSACFSWAPAESIVDEFAVVPPSFLPFPGLFRVRPVGGVRLVSAGGSRRRPGRRRVASFRPSVLRVVPRSLGCGVCPPFWLEVLFLALSLAPVATRGGSGVVLTLRVFVVPGVCLRVPRLWRFRRFCRGLVFWPFFAAFSYCSGARQVERFAACSFRHLPQVVFHLAGSLAVFPAFAAPRSRRLLRGGAYTDCAGSGAPGSSVDLSLGRSVEER